MSNLKSTIYLLQVVLWFLAAAVTLVGFLYPHQDINLYASVWGYIIDGEIRHPLVLGVIPLTHLAFYLGLILLYLNFEFYGFKSGFYGVIALTILMVAAYFIVSALNQLAEGSSPHAIFDRRILMFFTLTRREFISQTIAYVSALTLLFSTAFLLRKATTHYFMFFRFTIASLIGWGTFVSLKTYFDYSAENSLNGMIIFAATPLAQFILLTAGSIIPLYFLRLLLSLFRGRAQKESTNSDSHSEYRSQQENSIGAWIGRIFSWFVFFPLLWGALTAGGIFATAKGYALGLKHGIISSAPAFFDRIAADPVNSSKQLGVLAALFVIVFNFLFGISPLFIKGVLKLKKSKKESSLKQSLPSAPLAQTEETVSEKFNSLSKPA